MARGTPGLRKVIKVFATPCCSTVDLRFIRALRCPQSVVVSINPFLRSLLEVSAILVDVIDIAGPVLTVPPAELINELPNQLSSLAECVLFSPDWKLLPVGGAVAFAPALARMGLRRRQGSRYTRPNHPPSHSPFAFHYSPWPWRVRWRSPRYRSPCVHERPALRHSHLLHGRAPNLYSSFPGRVRRILHITRSFHVPASSSARAPLYRSSVNDSPHLSPQPPTPPTAPLRNLAPTHFDQPSAE